MKKFINLIVFIAAVQFSFAQKNPVHFSFSTERKNDSLVSLIVRAQVDTGFLLFNAQPQNTDNPFISQ